MAGLLMILLNSARTAHSCRLAGRAGPADDQAGGVIGGFELGHVAHAGHFEHPGPGSAGLRDRSPVSSRRGSRLPCANLRHACLWLGQEMALFVAGRCAVRPRGDECGTPLTDRRAGCRTPGTVHAISVTLAEIGRAPLAGAAGNTLTLRCALRTGHAVPSPAAPSNRGTSARLLARRRAKRRAVPSSRPAFQAPGAPPCRTQKQQHRPAPGPAWIRTIHPLAAPAAMRAAPGGRCQITMIPPRPGCIPHQACA